MVSGTMSPTSRSVGSSAISSLGIGYDVETASSARDFPSSSSIVRAPTSVVRQQSQLNAQSSATSSEPSGVHAKSLVLHKKDFLDRVFEKVESTVCRVRPDPLEPPIIKKKVVIEERENIDHPASPPPNENGDLRESPCAVPTGGTPKRSILKKHDGDVFDDLEDPQVEDESNDTETYTRSLKEEGDLLDYIFENVEGFACRNDELIETYEGSDEHDNDSSPLKLHRLHKVPRTDQGEAIPAKPFRKDALDYLFECGRADNTDDQQLQMQPTPAAERDILDYMFECRGGEAVDDSADLRTTGPDCRDPCMRAPMSPERTNSILNDSSNDSSRLSRLEILRNRKREIESAIRREESQLDEEGAHKPYLVPRGYSKAKPGIYDSSLADSQFEYERNRRIRRTLIAGVVMFLVGSALILIALSFFFPLRV